jgi:23S rRNA (cytidine1920-2'-O)/16S rRNA (cytidine1409-2'-O)-methyltransferase
VPERLDLAMVARGISPTREKARAEILAGNVLVDETPADKPGARVRDGQVLRLRAEPMRYVSRGGLKLEAALDTFAIDPKDRVACDLGASTGGFTDCLLQRGAARVYAIDVGYGQLAWTLRNDPRVVAMERCNARHLDALPERVSLLVADLSFISVTTMLPPIVRFTAPGADVVLLVKPQFEVGRDRVGKRGLVRDDDARLDALERVLAAARAQPLQILGYHPCPVPGRKSGNREWLLWLRVLS